MHCTHTPQNTGSSPLPNRPKGGCRFVDLSKRAKKHSITADCGELKATFGPRLRGTAKQKVKQ